MTTRNKMRVNKTVILPILTYASVSWGQFCKSAKLQIERQDNLSQETKQRIFRFVKHQPPSVSGEQEYTTTRTNNSNNYGTHTPKNTYQAFIRLINKCSQSVVLTLIKVTLCRGRKAQMGNQIPVRTNHQTEVTANRILWSI